MKEYKRSPGVTLIEMVLYSALMLTVFSTVFGIFVMAIRSYQLCDAKINVQRAALTTSLRLAKELEEASIYSVAIYRPEDLTPGAPLRPHYPHGYYDSSSVNNLAGISFLSPRKAASTGAANPDKAEFDSSGSLQFWSCVCYYLVSQGGNPPLYTLKRKMKTFTAAQTVTTQAMYSPEYFYNGAGKTTLKEDIIARNIYSLDIYWWNESGTGTNHDSYGYSALTPTSKIQYGLYNPGAYDSSLYVNIASYDKNINGQEVMVTAKENVTFYNNK
ncbi:MAG: hypothetical protein RDV48_18035 [Candidatus Eremiobacteraeota bacterium]|nr:hypothetical protein [Candidatus Eremiobacteraeota bacterium]